MSNAASRRPQVSSDQDSGKAGLKLRWFEIAGYFVLNREVFFLKHGIQKEREVAPNRTSQPVIDDPFRLVLHFS